ncbi:cytochrome C oxidase Cbb3 [Paramesorhizobium deserti]|uniref:Cbb3-type cytochrome c oxidase subunit n=1 Tax=Paramesorhizobium deserti TaxID=1494590 RepID=A0A135HPM7_9HYPH|nr:cytochrome-c oxidase, cbb3-type subunit III [Paramesorhizobium deserti]KXF75120.1 cytochrome C oxidase Cbb3 [Paramesorhizobium deserti]
MDDARHIDGKRIDEKTGVETTGHFWDGIQELNNPLPRWWLWTFYATIIWAIGYTIMYPAWPMLTSATGGYLGYSSRAEVRDELATAEAARGSLVEAVRSEDVAQIVANPVLKQFAISAGAAAFKVNCVQCHGSGAQGSAGYPNLNDDDWLWGGDIESIYTTINHGVRYAADEETRQSEMPSFDGVLTPDQMADVAAYVVSLSGTPKFPDKVEAGATLFAENCASCHGSDAKAAKGVDAEAVKDLGAPDLADAIWLYGSGENAVVQQMMHPRNGVMPAWGARLGNTTVKELAVYVHSLGGGQTVAAGQ